MTRGNAKQLGDAAAFEAVAAYAESLFDGLKPKHQLKVYKWYKPVDNDLRNLPYDKLCILADQMQATIEGYEEITT